MRGATTDRAIPQSTISFIATVGCIGLVLFLIAATVVLALIPVFISKKQATLDSNTLKSQVITMTMPVEQSADARRKRTVGDLCDFVGGTFDSTGNDLVKAKLLSMLPSTTVSDLSISQVSFGYAPSSRRRRFASSKRDASCPVDTILIVIEFYIIFHPSCLYTCQINKGPTLRQTLLTISLTTFIFTNVPILKNGVFYKYAPRIQCVSGVVPGVTVSQILPGLSSSSPSMSAVTGNAPSTNTTTTAGTTTTTTAGTTTNTALIG